jgi:hypothetical protein
MVGGTQSIEGVTSAMTGNIHGAILTSTTSGMLICISFKGSQGPFEVVVPLGVLASGSARARGYEMDRVPGTLVPSVNWRPKGPLIWKVLIDSRGDDESCEMGVSRELQVATFEYGKAIILLLWLLLFSIWPSHEEPQRATATRVRVRGVGEIDRSLRHCQRNCQCYE